MPSCRLAWLGVMLLITVLPAAVLCGNTGPASPPPPPPPPLTCQSPELSKLPFCDITLSFEARVADLLPRLNLTDKIAQTGMVAGAVPSLAMQQYNFGGAGFFRPFPAPLHHTLPTPSLSTRTVGHTLTFTHMHTRTHSRRQAKPCTACGQRASQTTCLLFRGAVRRAAPCAPRSSPHPSTCPMRGTATSGAPPPMLQARKRARFTTTISLPWPLETDRRAVEGLRGVLDCRTTLQTSILLVVRPPPPHFS
jgi:hypothetical protein